MPTHKVWPKVIADIKSAISFNVLFAVYKLERSGLSSELKAAFPDITPVQRPKVEEILIYDPYWLLGFVEAEGLLPLWF